MKTSGLPLFAFGLYVSTATAQIVQTGASLKLGDIYYYVSPFSQGKIVDGPLDIKSLPRAFGFTPITVVSDDGVDKEALPSLFGNWTSADDVWQPSFLSTVFLAGHAASPCLSKQSFYEDVRSLVLPFEGNSTALPSGPYFLDTASGDVYQAYRLYDDSIGSFTESLLQSPDASSFQPLSAHIPSSASVTIGVPSRLYYSPTPEKPLAGVRIGIKDIYDLAGMRKSNGNRAWWNLYPPAATTAPVVQRLLDAGAIVVGHQKTSQFANGESPTADWVDYHAPFNPRGDGYNNPSSSSAGAGASVGAYPWLDIALGSDTGGSVRGPAGAQGLFGNRPSHGLVSLDGVMPLSPTLDTPGFLVRDPWTWDAANKAMYGANYTSYAGSSSVAYPSKLYTVGLPAASSDAGKMIHDFANALAAFLGTEHSVFNLDSAWAATGPAELRSTRLSTLLSSTYATLITKEQIELVREPFFADYAAAHDGRRPFVNPVPLSRWAWGDSIPDAWYPEALHNKTVFMDWFNAEVLPASSSSASCSDSILIYPGSTGNPSPRNRYSASAPGAPLGFGTSRISVFAEVPDSVFPLGEVARPSTITGRDEFLPVAVNVLVAKGCDGLLVKLAQDLVREGVLTVPKAGGTMAGGDLLVRRDMDHDYLADMEWM
ncbi:glutamyl-tRNA amidotransferase [Sodiomyces alkalinus F11]|uniref:Glutamyl-tRNA amidotransferase n=1 Tax=Sodiomyces alkalinus (strain CBS 110278 / VKM F-3762 / F11) TaxID=1314773 RepID=A0A3N2PNY7_SODAK|nr:glutamyl-tRNA amidotransferase [Sodiomyces alkalinus F11]ROT36066.1 glutamyl-tRNA amidotransferase [Sodiomyces alkalinus F11]